MTRKPCFPESLSSRACFLSEWVASQQIKVLPPSSPSSHLLILFSPLFSFSFYTYKSLKTLEYHCKSIILHRQHSILYLDNARHARPTRPIAKRINTHANNVDRPTSKITTQVARTTDRSRLTVRSLASTSAPFSTRQSEETQSSELS